MPNHDTKYLRVQDVPRDRDDGECDHEEHIESEEADGDPSDPARVVREVMQKNGNDARSHGHGKPTTIH